MKIIINIETEDKEYELNNKKRESKENIDLKIYINNKEIKLENCKGIIEDLDLVAKSVS